MDALPGALRRVRFAHQKRGFCAKECIGYLELRSQWCFANNRTKGSTLLGSIP